MSSTPSRARNRKQYQLQSLHGLNADGRPYHTSLAPTAAQAPDRMPEGPARTTQGTGNPRGKKVKEAHRAVLPIAHSRTSRLPWRRADLKQWSMCSYTVPCSRIHAAAT
ncbi:hypothetical protein BGY98DRAFT_34725 [Russula aff. rugulosa BPL654]|nr:hypothetical protein BGY98DRAFT_34725 [Russula aff. rugulosa BPL654]